jgi:hypothetical protein
MSSTQASSLDAQSQIQQAAAAHEPWTDQTTGRVRPHMTVGDSAGTMRMAGTLAAVEPLLHSQLTAHALHVESRVQNPVIKGAPLEHGEVGDPG